MGTIPLQWKVMKDLLKRNRVYAAMTLQTAAMGTRKPTGRSIEYDMDVR